MNTGAPGNYKQNTMKQNRREFISTVAAAGAALPFTSILGSMGTGDASGKYPVRLFSKPLDAYDFSFMCECTARSGIGGFDMTVRPGGKVEPASVTTLLPKLSEEAKKYNLVIDMMTSGIVTTDDPYTEQVLRTASQLGITHYRLGYFEYDFKAGVWETLQKLRTTMKDITDLNRKYNIHGGYQNHAGTRVGGPVWDLYELLRGLPPEYAGCQYDVRHAMVEGANSWIVGMRLIASHIKTLAIKDFTWMTVKGRTQAVTVPLGEGMVDWDSFFRSLMELDIVAPMTLHIEYPLLENGEENLPLNQQQEIIVRKLKKDVDFLNSYLKKYRLA